MIKVYERLTEDKQAEAVLVLPFELRQKSRQRASLEDGREIGLVLGRGEILRNGDYLRAENGLVIRIEAANEQVSTLYHDDGLTLARACYHLGNRHVPLQIGVGWLRYRHDHVLDAMLKQMGLEIEVEMAPFEPEGGAYGGHHHHAHEH